MVFCGRSGTSGEIAARASRVIQHGSSGPHSFVVNSPSSHVIAVLRWSMYLWISRRLSGKWAFAALVLLATCAVTGCFEWTQDPQGNTTSFGVPGAGAPIWQSKTNPAPLN